MKINTTTITTLHKSLYCLDHKSPKTFCQYAEIKPYNDNLLITSVLEGYIASRHLVNDDSMKRVVSKRSIYVNQKCDKILKKIINLKLDQLTIEDHNDHLLIEGHQVPYVIGTDYPTLEGFFTAPTAYEIKINGKLLEKLLKSLDRHSTQRQDIILHIPKDNLREIRVHTDNNNQQGIIMPMEIKEIH